LHRRSMAHGLRDGADCLRCLRLKQLEAENAKLKRVVADMTLGREALKELLAKNF